MCSLLVAMKVEEKGRLLDGGGILHSFLSLSEQTSSMC